MELACQIFINFGERCVHARFILTVVRIQECEFCYTIIDISTA